MGLHKIAKYIIIPGVHQPTGVWELLINKKVWDKLEKRDQALIECSEVSDVRVGHPLDNDAKALKQYKEEGNEIIVLDASLKKQLWKSLRNGQPRMQRKTSGLKKCMTIRLNLINFGQFKVLS